MGGGFCNLWVLVRAYGMATNLLLHLVEISPPFLVRASGSCSNVNTTNVQNYSASSLSQSRPGSFLKTEFV